MSPACTKVDYLFSIKQKGLWYFKLEVDKNLIKLIKLI